jgi:hypothetical protein
MRSCTCACRIAAHLNECRSVIGSAHSNSNNSAAFFCCRATSFASSSTLDWHFCSQALEELAAAWISSTTMDVELVSAQQPNHDRGSATQEAEVSSSSSFSNKPCSRGCAMLRAVCCDSYAADVSASTAASALLQPARSGAVLLLCLALLCMLLSVYLHVHCHRRQNPELCSVSRLPSTTQRSAAALRCCVQQHVPARPGGRQCSSHCWHGARPATHLSG